MTQADSYYMKKCKKNDSNQIYTKVCLYRMFTKGLHSLNMSGKTPARLYTKYTEKPISRDILRYKAMYRNLLVVRWPTEQIISFSWNASQISSFSFISFLLTPKIITQVLSLRPNMGLRPPSQLFRKGGDYVSLFYLHN